MGVTPASLGSRSCRGGMTGNFLCPTRIGLGALPTETQSTNGIDAVTLFM